MTFIGYEPGSKGYQFWDKDSRSVLISRDVKFNKSKFPYRKDLDYKNPFANEKRRSISVKNRRKTTNESDTDTEVGLVIPSTSNSDDDHRPAHPAPAPQPGAPPPVPPKNSPGSEPKTRRPSKTEKTTRPDEKPSTTISPEPDVKSELRYLIIQAIRSQWELQDFPTLGNQYHVMDDIASQEHGYNTCAPN